MYPFQPLNKRPFLFPFFTAMESTHSKINLLTLGALGLPFEQILNDLPLKDKIRLASTNTTIRELCLFYSRELREINEQGHIDLAIFPDLVTHDDIESLYNTFPDLTKIVTALSHVDDHFLDNLRIFKSLQKLSIYVKGDDINYNRHGLNLPQITIKGKYLDMTTNAIHSLLWQVRGTKKISIYGGHIDHRTIALLSTRNLKILKIQNTVISPTNLLANAILEMNQLDRLHLITSDYFITPHACYTMSDITMNLHHFRNLSITKLAFTVDITPDVIYSNLRYLKNLRELVIYYSIRGGGENLEKLIYYSASLLNVDTTFIEFTEKYAIRNIIDFEILERKSYFYKNVIESMDNYINVIPLDYTSLRRELNF